MFTINKDEEKLQNLCNWGFRGSSAPLWKSFLRTNAQEYSNKASASVLYFNESTQFLKSGYKYGLRLPILSEICTVFDPNKPVARYKLYNLQVKIKSKMMLLSPVRLPSRKKQTQDLNSCLRSLPLRVTAYKGRLLCQLPLRFTDHCFVSHGFLSETRRLYLLKLISG